jgi:predicted RNA-binding protein with TRAM domain
MGNSGGRTFWATIDRISNRGNGVVEKDDGGHFIVGPVREEAVGKTVEVRMVGPNEGELVDSDLRKDVYAEQIESTARGLSEGDIVSGRILKQSAEGIPLLEKEGIRIEVPGAELNDEVKIKVEEISGSNSQWVTATGTPVEQDIATDDGHEGSAISRRSPRPQGARASDWSEARSE